VQLFGQYGEVLQLAQFHGEPLEKKMLRCSNVQGGLSIRFRYG